MPATKKSTYPYTAKIKGRTITLRLMATTDRDAVLAFAQSLPEEDLLFLPIDISHPKVVDGWMRTIGSGRTTTIVAEEAGRLIGMGTLVKSETAWARHIGNMRLLVSPAARGLGLGSILANEVFMHAHASGLRKIIAQMAADERGFEPQCRVAHSALRRAHVRHHDAGRQPARLHEGLEAHEAVVALDAGEPDGFGVLALRFSEELAGASPGAGVTTGGSGWRTPWDHATPPNSRKRSPPTMLPRHLQERMTNKIHDSSQRGCPYLAA